LALQVGHVAQLALAVVQHSMPQAAFAVDSCRQHWQPASNNDDAPRTRANSLMSFISDDLGGYRTFRKRRNWFGRSKQLKCAICLPELRQQKRLWKTP
jgi:hypothetical protein